MKPLDRGINGGHTHRRSGRALSGCHNNYGHSISAIDVIVEKLTSFLIYYALIFCRSFFQRDARKRAAHLWLA